jgi:FlaG/FlaF family flagellin (archaellin)
MKSTLSAITGIGILIAPLFCFAQPTQATTRADVQAQLIQIEHAGYNPARRDDAKYPADIQSAEAKVTAQGATNDYSRSGMGAGTGSISESSGHGSTRPTTSTLYEHH